MRERVFERANWCDGACLAGFAATGHWCSRRREVDDRVAPRNGAPVTVAGAGARGHPLEAGLLVQGPQAAALLAQLGADVIKVELPGFGDQSRWLPDLDARRPAQRLLHGLQPGEAQHHDRHARRRQGATSFLRLADQADVVITNFKPGTMDALGPRLRRRRRPQPAGRVRRRVGVRADRPRRPPRGRRPRRRRPPAG